MEIQTRGFTLIELLVVIAIIGVLSSVVLASLDVAGEKADDARRLSDAHSLMNALQMYYDDHGTYPSDPGPWSPGNAPSGVDHCGGDGRGDDCVGNFGSLLVPQYIGSIPHDPVYAYTPNDYQYCTVDPAGHVNTYALIIREDTLVPSYVWGTENVAVSNALGYKVYYFPSPQYEGPLCRVQTPFINNPNCPYNRYPPCSPPYND